MLTQIAPNPLLPYLTTTLPRTQSRRIIERDRAVFPLRIHRQYPLGDRARRRRNGRRCGRQPFSRLCGGYRGGGDRPFPPRVVERDSKAGRRFLHMSGTDFYYESMVSARRKAGALAPGNVARRVYFGNSGTEAVEAAIKLARYHTGRDKFIAFLGVVSRAHDGCAVSHR